MPDSEPKGLSFKPQAATYNRILLTARLAIISFLMGVVVYYQAKFGRLGDYIPALAPVAVTYLLTIIYAVYLGLGSRQTQFAYIQLFIDPFLIGWVIYSTGGLNSPFSFMYVLVIVASVFYGPAFMTYILAGLSSTLYSGLLLLEHYGSINPYHPFPPIADPSVLYYVMMTASVNSLTFFFVAAMSGHITGLLSRTGQELRQRIEDFTMLKAFHENVLRNMGLGFMAVDLNRMVLSANPAAERILGLKEIQLVKRPIDKVLHLPEITEFFENLEEGWVEERNFHWVYPSENGEERYFSMSMNKFLVGDSVHGAIAVFQDMTELKMMERSVAESERLAAIGKVAAIIAHEIRNPLASLSGSIQMLNEDLSGIIDDHSRKLFRITMREADRLNNIITDFLDYSSPQNLTLTQVDIEELINEVMTLLKSSPKFSAGLQFSVNVENQLRTMADQEKVRQVLWNLILNAQDAMPQGGLLTISAAKTTFQKETNGAAQIGMDGKSWIRITIEDSGEGINQDILEDIFEPFYTTKPSGTGLGLPSAKKIVESHGGRIDAASVPDQGSTFTIWLPQISGEAQPGEKEENP